MRTSNYEIIENWIQRHRPNGHLQLSKLSGVSVTTIYNARQGFAPSREETRLKLCKSLGVTENKLFPEEK
jgi:transcriptional regulator with XRE-family HTH domain